MSKKVTKRAKRLGKYLEGNLNWEIAVAEKVCTTDGCKGRSGFYGGYTYCPYCGFELVKDCANYVVFEKAIKHALEE